MKHRADGFVVVDAPDGLGEGLCDGQDCDLVDALFGGDRDCVCDDHFCDVGALDALDRGATEDRVGGSRADALGAMLEEEGGGFTEGACCGDLVIDEDGIHPIDAADEVCGFGLLAVVIAAFVDDRHWQAELAREAACVFGFANVTCDDHGVAEVAFGEVVTELVACGELIHWDAKEALDLRGMEVHCEHAVCA